MRLSKIAMAGALAAIIALAGHSYADEPTPTPAATGSVSGTVKGVDGKPVAGVQVRLLAPDAAKPAKPTADDPTKKPAGKANANAVATATTDEQGAYKMENVPAGTYTINASKQGLGRAKESITVKAGENVAMDLTLKASKKKAS